MMGARSYDAEIQYLQSTGTQYVDTGIVPSTPSDSAYLVMASTKIYVSNDSFRVGGFFGVLDGYGTNDFGVRRSWYAGYYGAEMDNRVIANTDAPENNTIHEKITKWMLSAATRWVEYDGSRIENNVQVVTSLTYSGTSWLFGCNGIGTGGGLLLPCRIYRYQFWRNGVLVQNMFPVRVADVGYLFDKVTHTLFGNAGSGAFICGPDGSYQQGGG
jgi:hypothetical protein